MEIIVNQEATIHFGQLKPGDICCYGNLYYLKTQPAPSANCTELTTWRQVWLQADAKVILKKATLTIE